MSVYINLQIAIVNQYVQIILVLMNAIVKMDLLEMGFSVKVACKNSFFFKLFKKFFNSITFL